MKTRTKSARLTVVAGACFALLAFAGESRQQPLVCSGQKTPPDSGPRLALPTNRYFDPHSPQRRNLRGRGIAGVPLTLTGRVFDESCAPVARALLDFFQADSRGKYDRKEIRLHGHQFADAQGGYLLRTIVPNHYLSRPPHIHVKVQAPSGPVLETQLFFPATLRAYGMRVGRLNARDRTLRRTHGDLAVHLGPRTGDGYRATFDFVIALTP
jgi:protocatechuate 3,4-dioxygenase beta subunit